MDDSGVTTPPPSVSQQELESWLWKAADILRGPVDPVYLRDFIFPLLFLKRLSDAWDDEHAEAAAEWGDGLTPEIAADFHKFDIPDGCHWNDLRRVAENHGIEIQKITQRIEQKNPKHLRGIFGRPSWADPNRMPPAKLQSLIDHFNRYNISPKLIPNDILGGAYEYLLKKFSDGDGRGAGQYFTPRPVVRLLVKILSPEPNETVYDPACGSAGMLIEAANEIKSSGNSINQMRFYGQEENQTSSAIARMNLYIHDVDDAKIIRDDTLRNPRFVKDKGKLQEFNVVIANPPFSQKEWGKENWANDPHSRPRYGGVPGGNKADFAWVQHMLASANESNGRVGVVLPLGALSRHAEAEIRKHIVEEDLLEAIISLGRNLFYGTSIPACLLIFQKQKIPKYRGKVRFIDGSERYQKVGSKNILSDEDIEAIFMAYQDSDSLPDGVKQSLVDIKEIKSHGWNLNIGIYVEQDEIEAPDTREAISNLSLAQKRLAEAQQSMNERLKAAGYA